MEVVVTTGAIRRCKATVKVSPPTNQHPAFYETDALPVAQPTVSQYRRKKYHIPQTCSLLAHLGVLWPNLWPIKAPLYLEEGCQACCQPSDAGTPGHNITRVHTIFRDRSPAWTAMKSYSANTIRCGFLGCNTKSTKLQTDFLN